MVLDPSDMNDRLDPAGAAIMQQVESSGTSEQELWRRFAEASTPRAFYESWLSLQCRMIEGVQSALILLGMPDRGPFTPVTVWPSPEFNVKHLVPAAERALKERRGLLVEDESAGETGPPVLKGYHIAYPISVSEKVHGVVVMEVSSQAVDRIQSIMQQVHWGTAWLEVMLLRADALASAERNERLKQVLDSVASSLEHERFQPAAMAFVTRLATMLECDRVSLGFMGRKQLRIQALSHSAEFGERANLMRAVEAVMEEAVDQQAVIVYPPPPEAPPLVTTGHEALARQYGAGAICTVPLGSDNAFYGALTIEVPANKTLDDHTIELIRTIASLAGPILNTKRKEDRWLVAKAAEKGVESIRGIFGPRHLALKACGVVILIVVVFFAFVEGTYRVKAPTVLEGLVQRIVSAPFSGYIAEVKVRPGDVVQEGALLCRLDDRNLRLEHGKWVAQREQLAKEHRGAMAKHDFAQVRIMGARINQAQAEIALLEEQLSRSRIQAPFAGVVMSGDLSQSLGAPVERGQVLFEVAPLDSYRVIVQVDERNIGEIKVGQRGELALPSLPGEVFPLTINTITPVSTAKEGRNYFRVEAQVEKISKRLRPGMEGVGKVEIGQRKLIWIWTHEMIDWVRLKLWSWLP